MARQNILIVSYLFPPAGGIGVQRALSFAKYLPEDRFNVSVLRAHNAAAPVMDPGLLAQVPQRVKIYSAFTPEIPFAMRQMAWRIFSRGDKKPADPQTPALAAAPKSSLRNLPLALVRRVLCPEPEVAWVPFALRKIRQIMRQKPIDSVLITAPPFSAFLVGIALKREFPHIKLISDFRDDWLRFYLTEFAFQNSDYTRRKAAQIERDTVELSDLVLAVTRHTLAEIRGRYPDQPDSKFALIPNGYDPDAFANFHPRKHGHSKMVVTHMGTVYSASSAKYYLDALDSLPADIRERIETRFVGRITAEEEVHFANRAAKIEKVGFLPQKAALAYLEDTDYLLVTLTDDGSIPGKIFEYLATGKPILAISPKTGELFELIRNTSAGWCAAPENGGAIRTMLVEALERCTERNPVEPDWNAIQRFERPRIAQELGQLLGALA